MAIKAVERRLSYHCDHDGGNSPAPKNQESNMNDIRELNDAELEAVSGGMTCETATVVATIHKMTAIAAGALGLKEKANNFYGYASGVVEGACG